MNITLNKEYINKNMVGDEDWIPIFGNEKNGKVFKYRNNIFLIRGFSANCICLYRIMDNFSAEEVMVSCENFYNWMIERTHSRIERELRQYDLNQIEI